MKRTIVHCDLDSFFVSVERLLHPELNGKPVIVGGKSCRSVVASCSYEARKFGVHSAMSVQKALRLCPEAIVVQSDFSVYSSHSRQVTQIIRESAPIVEKASIDEHYLDLSEMDKYRNIWKWVKELRQQIMKETGLPISFGMANTKTTAKIATGEAKPCGELKIEPGKEKEFLAPLLIQKIPMVGEKTCIQLQNQGIFTCADVQKMEQIELQQLLGKHGVKIWQKANGVYNSPVVPFREQKSMSKETTFLSDTKDDNLLKQTLAQLVNELVFDLRKEKKQTTCVAIKVRYEDFSTYTRQKQIPATDLETVIFQNCKELFFNSVNNSRLVRLVGVKFSNLVQENRQLDLFYSPSKEKKLNQTIDELRSRYGIQSVNRGDGFVEKE
ncbi:MAG: DNA polymerase IV [Weeksellaceae bacterium]|jgi:DNA polymerase-4|nr:DNA polymerase IV [Weeksellaceae bacterium]